MSELSRQIFVKETLPNLMRTVTNPYPEITKLEELGITDSDELAYHSVSQYLNQSGHPVFMEQFTPLTKGAVASHQDHFNFFISTNLSYGERSILLFHMFGHIALGHMISSNWNFSDDRGETIHTRPEMNWGSGIVVPTLEELSADFWSYNFLERMLRSANPTHPITQIGESIRQDLLGSVQTYKRIRLDTLAPRYGKERRKEI